MTWPESTPPAKRSVIVVCSLILPGGGHAVNGQWRRAGGWLGAYLALQGAAWWAAPIGGILLSSTLIRLMAALDAARRRRGMARRGFVLRVALAILCAGLVWVAWRQVFPSVRIHGDSMKPTLLPGDLVMTERLSRLWGALGSGVVVVLTPPGPDNPLIVKRIAATGHAPGDWKLDPNTLAVLSDNLSRGPDSRHFGSVPASHVFARVHRIVWSWDEETQRVRWSRLGRKVR